MLVMSPDSSAKRPLGRTTGSITPVDVSLCGNVYVSTSGFAFRDRRGSRRGLDHLGVVEVWRRARDARANFDENSPHTRCCARRSIRPNAAASQNEVEPPLPRSTS